MNKLILFFVLLLGGSIRFFRLEELMLFIGDQGWFYNQAKAIIENHELPLVGITSSHIWLHQGSYWSYILASVMNTFGYNPVWGAYLTVLAGIFTIWLVYYIGSQMFSERVGLTAAILYSFSPLVIIHSRMSYHTSLIPLVSTVLIFVLFKWVTSGPKVFPFIVFLLAVLYNFELATFVLVPAVGALFFYGYLKGEHWARGVKDPKILAKSLVFFLVPMIPMIVYDIQYGYNQTVRFGVWVVYRVAVFLGYPPLHPDAPGETWSTFIPYALTLVKRFFFIENLTFSIILFVAVILILFYKTGTELKKSLKMAYLVISLFIVLPALGYIAAKTNSEPYVLVMFPTLAIGLGIMFDILLSKKSLKVAVILVMLFIISSNSYSLISRNYLMGKEGYGIPYSERKKAIKKIIDDAQGKGYNLVGRGNFSQYESFLSSYEYLAWWQNHPPSKQNEKLKFYVSEHTDRIVLERR